MYYYGVFFLVNVYVCIYQMIDKVLDRGIVRYNDYYNNFIEYIIELVKIKCIGRWTELGDLYKVFSLFR